MKAITARIAVITDPGDKLTAVADAVAYATSYDGLERVGSLSGELLGLVHRPPFGLPSRRRA